MAEVKHIFIICGEPSGDLNAGNLAKALKQLDPGIKISGIGGPILRQNADQAADIIKELAVIGLFDALKKLPQFYALKNSILQKIKSEKPNAIILVDFSGFNLRLARDINKTIPTIYYISPQVWASRPGRIETIKKYIHKMIVLFKFEEEFYRRHGIKVDFIGHPLLDIVQPSMNKSTFLKNYGLAESKTTIALLPGSRRQEIRNILPTMLKTSVLIAKKLPNTQFIIAKSPCVDWDIYNRKIRNTNLDIKIAEGKTYDCLNAADFCLVASGTATLETAIMEKPFLIIYKMNLLNYLLYRPQVKLTLIGMVNIVAKKKIIPEFIQLKARPKRISQEALRILSSPAQMQKIKDELARVKATLGDKGAATRAAKIILDFIK